MEILKLVLRIGNLAEAIRFYHEKLGLEVLFQDVNKLVFQVGFSELIFEKVKEGSNPQFHFAFLIPTNSIEQAYPCL